MPGPEGEKPFINESDKQLKISVPSFYPVPPEYFVAALRSYLRDIRNKNFLFDLKYAHEDEQLREAWGRALLDFNETPPTFNRKHTFADSPRYILLKKAASEALFSLVNYLQLNETAYQDGEQSFQINQQWKSIVTEANRLNQEYTQERMRIKMEINANLVYHGSHSEFGNYFRELQVGGADPQAGTVS
jgi:hypothetical protein